MSDQVDDLISSYVRQGATAGAAYRGDATFHAEMQMARRWLSAMNDAMRTEGVSSEARERVLRTVIYGVPDPDVAVNRMAERQRRIEELERLSPLSHLLREGP
jgi:hypothetical protein